MPSVTVLNFCALGPRTRFLVDARAHAESWDENKTPSEKVGKVSVVVGGGGCGGGGGGGVCVCICVCVCVCACVCACARKSKRTATYRCDVGFEVKQNGSQNDEGVERW
jgi:hypothetical protein